MPSSSVCWGIEVGASAVKAIKLEAVGDSGARITEYAVIQHPRPLSTPGVDANDVLRVSLGALTSQHDLSKASVAVSMPGHAGFARFAKLPPVDPKRVSGVVRYEAMQQIPFPLEQVEWDYQTFVSPSSPDVEVGIFAVTKDRVNERLAMLADVGINPNYVVLGPIALYNALAYDLQFDDKTPGTIIVDVGTTSTDLVVATPGKMWVRTFPIGGHQFTDALVSQFQLSYPKAEKLKREAEDSRHARQVFQAMRPVFTDLASDIQRSIGYFQSLNKDVELTRLIGVGSTFALPGLRKYLKQQLSMDVYRIEEFKRIKLEGAKEGDDKSVALNDMALQLVTAYGLALHGLGLNSVGGNLMPTNVLRKAMWKEKVPWFGMAAGVAALAGGAMFIGPARDYFEVSSHAPAQVIESALRDATGKKTAATAAGVTTAGEPDYRAANAAALKDKKGTYELISSDLYGMFADADKTAQSWAQTLKMTESAPLPAFNLVKFETTYEGPGGAGGPGGFVDASAGAEPAGISEHPRIMCRLVMTTDQPEPRRFVTETVQKWLESNAKRKDVPYTLKFLDPSFRIEASQDVASDASGAPAAPGDIFGGGEGGRDRGRAFRRGGSGGGSNPGETILPDGGRIIPIVPGGGPASGFGGPGAGGGGQPSPDATAALTELNKMAQLNAPPQTRKQTATVTVTWWAAFLPPEPPPADGAAKDATNPPKTGGGS
ncbi:MAG: type IV pilus assembly protein PilM [Tepidisphaera sp.]|nr:type IV pilus assembly protein PilM [Tepidisphaera sp.]